MRDLLKLLESGRGTKGSRRASAKDFTAPAGTAARHIDIPPPGVVHPALVPWIAAALGRTRSQVMQTLAEEGVEPLAVALSTAQSAKLQKRGVAPSELLLRRLPLPQGKSRRNPRVAGSGPVLSSLNAMLLMFDRECRSLAKFIELGAPEIIVQARARGLQTRFEAVVALLEGRSLPLEKDLDLPTDPPTPPQLIIPPPDCGGWFDEPARPFSVLLEGNTAVVRYHSALARIDLATGALSVHPVGEAGLVRLRGGKALLVRGSRLVVFDTRADAFTLAKPPLPARVVLGACCGVSILDTRTRKVALLPGPLASSGFDVSVSACGNYGWMHLAPAMDDVGVFSVERLESVFQPWPHAKLRRPTIKGELGEGHDDTPRALVARGRGFRLLYGRHVIDGPRAWALASKPNVAAFDARGDQLVTLDETALTLHALDGAGKPTVVKRWACDGLTAHLAPTLPGADLASLMPSVGTAARLAGLRPEELAERLWLEPSEAASLVPLLEAARALSLPSQLQPLS